MAIVTYDPKDYHEIIKCAWEKYPDFHSIVNATTTEVTEKTVCYTDENGVSHTLEADSVVICGGMKAQRDEALAFYGAAPRFFMTGDCEKVANLQAGNPLGHGQGGAAVTEKCLQLARKSCKKSLISPQNLYNPMVLFT